MRAMSFAHSLVLSAGLVLAASVAPGVSHAQYALDDGQPPLDTVADSAPLDLHAWLETHRKFNTWGGSTGGFGLVDPSSGAPGSFRMQLGFDFFSSTDVLSTGDSLEANGQSLSLTWTALEMLEAYALVVNRSAVSENIQALGDITLGGKLFHHFTPIVSWGGDLRVNLNSGIGSATPDLGGTSLGVRTAFTADFRGAESPIPLIGRVNLGYLWDNSGALAKDGEADRYEMVPNPLPRNDETRHLLTRQERFGLGINRVDTISLGLGAELPLEVARDFYLHPLVEWQWGIPVNRQGYDCPSIVGAPNRGEVDGEQDSCLDKEGVAAWPMTLSFGMRAVTPLRGISAFAGADFGLTGTSKFVRELAPTAPYRVLFGLSVDYDARPAQVQIVEREVQVEIAPEVPVTGHVAGVVLEDGFNTPVVGAAVTISGSALSALSTDEEGRFVTYDLPPGELQFAVTHPDYREGTCVGTIGADGSASEVRCTLAALPKLGRVEGRVLDIWGAPVAGARVMLTGSGAFSATTDDAGRFAQADVNAGDYTARVVTETHHIKVTTLRVPARKTASVEITVAALPTPRAVVLKPTEIQVKGNVRFARGSEVIDAKASLLLAELADTLLRNESLRVRIEGYFDSGSDEMQGLTRALAIRQRLIDAGVGAERLSAIGGTTKRVVFAIEQ